MSSSLLRCCPVAACLLVSLFVAPVCSLHSVPCGLVSPCPSATISVHRWLLSVGLVSDFVIPMSWHAGFAGARVGAASHPCPAPNSKGGYPHLYLFHSTQTPLTPVHPMTLSPAPGPVSSRPAPSPVSAPLASGALTSRLSLPPPQN